ncbi:hypothetical protein D910_05131 [Dendroctonus ponderosae]|uniref:Uncharacterized protein n=1 Tax=Dendroctonus ponderosae TaxID=77166 RepID=U4U3V8_DENPD|nr:hypothetical protein D910_05131 [Dendroctonus ponderosae]
MDFNRAQSDLVQTAVYVRNYSSRRLRNYGTKQFNMIKWEKWHSGFDFDKVMRYFAIKQSCEKYEIPFLTCFLFSPLEHAFIANIEIDQNDHKKSLSILEPTCGFKWMELRLIITAKFGNF